MAYEHITLRIPGLKATGDLSSSQYLLVKAASTAGAVKVVSAATDDPVGVLCNEPSDGESAEVAADGIVKVKAGGTITWGTHHWLKVDSTGQVQASSTDQDNVVGYVADLDGSAAADGDIISMVWSPCERSTS